MTRKPSSAPLTPEEPATLPAPLPEAPEALSGPEDAPQVLEPEADKPPEPYAALCRATIKLDQDVPAGDLVWIAWPPANPHLQMFLDRGYLVVVQTAT